MCLSLCVSVCVSACVDRRSMCLYCRLFHCVWLVYVYIHVLSNDHILFLDFSVVDVIEL